MVNAVEKVRASFFVQPRRCRPREFDSRRAGPKQAVHIIFANENSRLSIAATI
jgi:hypothetical protein